ncbi:type II toxin-antitoxin system VapC family toxin [Phyllobacterium sp. OV277]|uniref:type II toxin-antitoxin system VapC family toxin n=1 Tax=Phyllobacterium sp. OV277 TaxID=1882772 RepID=UPI000B886EF3|nr:type II toxin-antitoxin system VapC family toxin [Phyllobacterium sp. OV277]
MFYVDTSVLVAALTAEGETKRAQKWLSEQAPGEIAISNWTITEFSSALSIKLRTGQLDLKNRDEALSTFHRIVTESFKLFPVSNIQFSQAAKLADQHDLGLRAGDALHLAVVLDTGTTMCTLDKRFAYAADALGARVHQPH